MCGIDGGRPSVPASAKRHDSMSWHPVQLDKVYVFPGAGLARFTTAASRLVVARC